MQNADYVVKIIIKITIFISFENEGVKKWKEKYIEKLKSRLSEEENEKVNVDKI